MGKHLAKAVCNHTTRNIIIALVLISILLSSISLMPTQASAGSLGPDISGVVDLDVNYSDRGLEVVEVRVANKVSNSDGTYSADVTLISKTHLTYAMLLWVEGGQATGPVIDVLTQTHSTSCLLLGKATFTLGRITFTQGARLRVQLNKFGLRWGDELITTGFDLLTSLSLYAGTGHLGSAPDALWGLASQGQILFQNLNLDVMTIQNLVNRGNTLGILKLVAKAIEQNPQIVSQFCFNYVKVQNQDGTLSPLVVSNEVISKFAFMVGQIIGVIRIVPVITDLMQRPRAVEADIDALGADRRSIDTVLVIDRSPSMEGQPLTDAKVSAKLFINLMHDGDMISVVSFDGAATVNYPLTTVSAATKAAARAAVDGISIGSSTSIGAGLQAGQQQLSGGADPSHVHAMVLLTDGEENSPPYVADVLPSIVAARTVVYAIGLGTQANEQLLQSIAAQTGGVYTFAPSSDQLAAIYNLVANRVAGLQQVASGQGTIPPNGTDSKNASVGGREATFSITWPTNVTPLSLTLVTPGGHVIDPSDPNVEYFETNGFIFYRVTAPETGVWTYRTHNPGNGSVTYNYGVTALTDLKLSAYASAGVIRPGEPVIVSAMLFDGQHAITGASITASVQPTGDTMTLLDDGAHNDGDANDGIYAELFTRTTSTGSYTFHVTATGAGFTREDDVTVTVASSAPASADLWAMISGDQQAAPGANVTYSIVFGNSGPNGVTRATLVDTLPANTTFVSGSLGAPRSISQGRATWDLPAIPAQSMQTFSLTVSVPGSLSGWLTNQANIQPPSGVTDPALDNNAATSDISLDLPCAMQAFGDVAAGSTFYQYVMTLACRSILSGYSDGNFRPNNEVTRGQVAKIVANAVGFSEQHTEQTFTDVPVGSTFYQYVQRVASRGVISGYACGAPGEPCDSYARPYFRPNASASRGQISKIVVNSAIMASLPGWTLLNPSNNTFSDIPAASTFFRYVETAFAHQVLSGYACGAVGESCDSQGRAYFRSNNNATRGQTSKIVANTFFAGGLGPAPTRTPGPSPTRFPSFTPSRVPSSTRTPTRTPSVPSIPTSTRTSTLTNTPTNTATNTRTSTPTTTATSTHVPTATPTPSCPSTWTVDSSGSLLAPYGHLNDIAVVSPNDVWTVGHEQPSSGNYKTLVGHWDGAQWSRISSPNQGLDESVLVEITAIQSNDIWAVGYSIDASSVSHPLVEHWDGSSWTISPTPNLGTNYSSFAGVTALQSNDVWAVGSYGGPGPGQTLVEHWNGSSWSVVSSPNVGAYSNVLVAVDAVSSTDMWAAGEYVDLAGLHTLTLHWNGSSWSAVSSPDVGANSNILQAITAIASNDVWTVGDSRNAPLDDYQTLVEHWNGSSWSVVPSPNVGGFSNHLLGLDAASPSDIWAVGYRVDESIGPYPSLIEHWNGSSWTIVSHPADAFISTLSGVAVVPGNPQEAWAVGSANSQPLIERYSASCTGALP